MHCILFSAITEVGCSVIPNVPGNFILSQFITKNLSEDKLWFRGFPVERWSRADSKTGGKLCSVVQKRRSVEVEP